MRSLVWLAAFGLALAQLGCSASSDGDQPAGAADAGVRDPGPAVLDTGSDEDAGAEGSEAACVPEGEFGAPQLGKACTDTSECGEGICVLGVCSVCATLHENPTRCPSDCCAPDDEACAIASGRCVQAGDCDGDKVPNEEEASRGLSAYDPDSDKDGVRDGMDNCPAVANAGQSDVDQDGSGDNCDGSCVPDCEGRSCGPDGCGGVCGACSQATVCRDGGCVERSCEPECPLAECGDGPCGGAESVASCPQDCGPGGFSYVAPGELLMGSPETEPQRTAGEGPERTVRITQGFWLKTTEVTQGEWRELMGENPSDFQACGDDCPVDRVSWWESLAYCNELSRRDGLAECFDLQGCTEPAPGEGMQCTGLKVDANDENPLLCEGYRLPTEAEWEHAARAGTTTALYNGALTNTECSPVDEALDVIAWYAGNSHATYAGAYDCSPWGCLSLCGPHPVGTKAPNPWGLHDMSGGVWEWAWDGYDRSYYSTRPDPDADPLGPSGEPHRVVRGGAWLTAAHRCRSATRNWHSPNERNLGVGFRPARSVPR